MRTRIFAVLFGVALLSATLASGQQAVASDASKDTATAVVRYVVWVKTGNLPNAGTDAHVYVSIRGTEGSTGPIELDDRRDNFERAAYEGYVLVHEDLGEINRVCLYRDDAGPWDEWHIEYVAVEQQFVPSTRRTAPFNGWMPAFQWICRRAS